MNRVHVPPIPVARQDLGNAVGNWVADRGSEQACACPPQIPTCALTHGASSLCLGFDGKPLIWPQVRDGGFWPVEANLCLPEKPPSISDYPDISDQLT